MSTEYTVRENADGSLDLSTLPAPVRLHIEQRVDSIVLRHEVAALRAELGQHMATVQDLAAVCRAMVPTGLADAAAAMPSMVAEQVRAFTLQHMQHPRSQP